MALVQPGNPISLSQVNSELGRPSTQNINMNDSAVRSLAGVPTPQSTISMSNLYGKSNRVALSLTYSSSTYSTVTVYVSSLSGYSAGRTDLTITVNYGVWLANGLRIVNNNYGDTVKIINLGVIAGTGGNGGSWLPGTYTPPTAGTDAIQLNSAAVFTIDNTYGSAWIAGGGGGGAGSPAASINDVGGGGGAGGGAGGQSGAYLTDGGAGGLIGDYGGVGLYRYGKNGGGGGGRIFPGVGGSGYQQGNNPGTAAGAGGGGGSVVVPSDGDYVYGSPGGSANSPGGSSTIYAGAGGGGWGASGGYSNDYAGAAGGKAVSLNGASLAFVSNDLTRVYGAVV